MWHTSYLSWNPGSGYARDRSSLQSPGTSTMGGLRPRLHQGDGHLDGQEKRTAWSRKTKAPADHYSQDRGDGQDSQPTSPAEVPKEAWVSRPKSSLSMMEDRVSPMVFSETCLSFDDRCANAVCKRCEDISQPASVPVDNHHAAKKSPRRSSPKSFAHEPVSQEPQLLTYSRWCSNLVPMVLRSRTPFGAFLSHTIQLSKVLSDDLAPTFFPVPIPPGYCHVMPANPSSCQRRQCHVSRVLHTMVMALNFWHSGGRFIEASSLQRAPNRLHRVLYRILSLLKSDGPALAFETTKAGRRFPELVAHLSELSSVLTFNGASGDPYDKTFPGVEVVKDDTVMPELQPYRDLDPDRLLLFGTGHFDATEFLDDALTMPYRDPACLSIDVPPGSRPNIRDSPETVCKLASVWDKQNLLTIHREHINPDKYVRVFNAYKSTSQDRQIGD